ncbi:YlmC/YmxH family sporulation protein [Tissierella sp. Yu-01]|jgi:YlmC/YmxH family sporulation protein|uniref:YlmC/YmxH family sporulation protein n=1 Tax=Tissierella sp. Yu-01 TaxID=3035694 RepID=UPI00240DA6CE|nr:YlmC/YmxH family sporulation protein [Tissierella sp. Yu-01]WFA09752.1 YlmC/YmxH family sporulation protein [Tissierella sp. Yu-01]
MKLSELGVKEVVNLNNGGRLGILADSDLVIDEGSGKIISILVPDRRLSLRIFGVEKNSMDIPWDAIRKIGYDMIIVELDY